MPKCRSHAHKCRNCCRAHAALTATSAYDQLTRMSACLGGEAFDTGALVAAGIALRSVLLNLGDVGALHRHRNVLSNALSLQHTEHADLHADHMQQISLMQVLWALHVHTNNENKASANFGLKCLLSIAASMLRDRFLMLHKKIDYGMCSHATSAHDHP